MLHTQIGIAEAAVGEHGGDVRRMLLECRRDLLNDIQSKVRDVRDVGSNHHRHSADLRETAEAEPEDDLVFALIEMRAETLRRVDAAVRQVDEGAYGYCVDCGEAIAVVRLRALPYAVRCRDCEGTREYEQRLEHVRWQRGGPGPARSRDLSGM